jgi:hypothetical protein
MGSAQSTKHGCFAGGYDDRRLQSLADDLEGLGDPVEDDRRRQKAGADTGLCYHFGAIPARLRQAIERGEHRIVCARPATRQAIHEGQRSLYTQWISRPKLCDVCDDPEREQWEEEATGNGTFL